MALRSNSATTIARRSAGLALATNARASSSVIRLCPRTRRARPDSPNSTVPPARQGQVSPATGSTACRATPPPPARKPRARRGRARRWPAGGERRAKGGVGGGGLVAPFERDDGLGLQPFTSRERFFPLSLPVARSWTSVFPTRYRASSMVPTGNSAPCSWRQGAASALSQHLSQTARVDIENEAPHRNVFRNPGM